MAFSWKVEAIESPADGEGRFKVTCRNAPGVFAFGDTEQQAIRAANARMEAAVDSDQVGISASPMKVG